MQIHYTDPTDKKPYLALVASRGLRGVNDVNGKRRGRWLDDFVSNYKDVLSKYHLLVTRGTFLDVFVTEDRRRALQSVLDTDDMPWESPIYSELTGTVLRRGKDGGLVRLSYCVSPVNRLQKSSVPSRPRCDTVIFLMDPADAEEQFPENRQLIRMTTVGSALLLLNYHSAAIWASHEAVGGAGGAQKVSAFDSGDTIALIAHDERKLDMGKFVAKYHSKLSRFHEIVATGTTGTHIIDFLKIFGDAWSKVTPQNSGPAGGDAEISDRIITGGCQHVCFFLDPNTAHPHEADIYALLRACTFEGCKVNLRLSRAAAESWISRV